MSTPESISLAADGGGGAAASARSSHKSLLPQIDWKLVLLCCLWYLTSVVANSSAKMILKDFTYPVTLTEIQFVMNAFYCLTAVYVVRKVESALSVARNSTGSRFDSLYDEPSYKSLLHSFPKGTFPDDLDSYNYSITDNFLRPSALMLKATLPMGMFQFLGQIAGNKATSVIPVSLVHTIKALSPLTTVLIYKVMFNKHFSLKTYATLLPLVLGVMLSCTRNVSMDHGESGVFHVGCIFAFISMLIFVSQNIFAKKILTYESGTGTGCQSVSSPGGVSAGSQDDIVSQLNFRIAKSDSAATTPILPVSVAFKARPPVTPLYGNSMQSLNKLVRESDKKLDKISVLFYCSVVGFILTLPFYLLSEWSNPVFSLQLIDRPIFTMMLVYGIAHFMQSIVAFQILGLISPINYSIANILKRIIVIGVSILLEGTQLTSLQWLGLLLTFSGLYAYDRWGVQRKEATAATAAEQLQNGPYNAQLQGGRRGRGRGAPQQHVQHAQHAQQAQQAQQAQKNIGGIGGIGGAASFAGSDPDLISLDGKFHQSPVPSPMCQKFEPYALRSPELGKSWVSPSPTVRAAP